LLTDDEWLLISNLVDILGQFDTITTTLSSSKFVTLSLIYPLIVFLKKNLSNILNAINDNEIVLPISTDDLLNEEEPEDQEQLPLPSLEENEQGDILFFEESNGERRRRKINITNPVNTNGLYKKVISTLYKSINHYWSDPSVIAMLASTLDPRFKHLKFVDEQLRLESLKILKEQYEMIKEQQQRLSIGSHYLGSVIPLGNNSGIFDELFDDLLQYEEQEVQGEYEKYFSLPTANRKTDPFAWWNK